MITRKPLRGVLAGAATLAVVGALTACAGGNGSAAPEAVDCETTTTIGFSHPVGEAEVVKALKVLLEQKAAEDGCIEVLFDSTTNNDLETQRAAIETWVTQGVDAIVVSPVDPTALAGLQEQAQADGTKWITYAIPGEGADGMAGFDSYTSGELVGDAALAWVEENHPDGGVTAAVTTLTPVTAAAGGRWIVPLEKFEESGLEVVSEQDCADQACGLEITESVLRQHPDLRVFIGFNDDAALGAITAFTNAGIPLDEVFIAGQDGGSAALAAVKDGTMNITAAIAPVSLAETILQVVHNAITGQGETDLMSDTLPATLDDPALLDDLIAQLNSAL